jgi:hypothetical protein
METEDYLGRSRLFRRLKNGIHGQHVERYATRLIEEGRVGRLRAVDTIACSPSSRRCNGPNYAECKGDDVRASDDGTATTTRRLGTARHSSAGGIEAEIMPAAPTLHTAP